MYKLVYTDSILTIAIAIKICSQSFFFFAHARDVKELMKEKKLEIWRTLGFTGWQGNVAKNQNLQQQQVAMMAPKNQKMMG